MDAYVEEVVRAGRQASRRCQAPPPLVDEEVDEMMRQLAGKRGARAQDLHGYLYPYSRQDHRGDSRGGASSAEQRVRTDLVLDAVAEAESIEVPGNEIEEQVHLVAGQPTYSTKERRRLLASDACGSESHAGCGGGMPLIGCLKLPARRITARS